MNASPAFAARKADVSPESASSQINVPAGGTSSAERMTQDAARAGAVYRMYDREGVLLYIGSTGNVAQRIHTHMTHHWEHSYSAEMRERFHSLDIEWYPTLEGARTAEREAIRSEAPLLNRKDNPTRWRHAGRAGYVAVTA